MYNDLTPQEKEQFAQAKQKGLKCWLDTDTVKEIMRERIHPSRIMPSRGIFNFRKAKARLAVKEFQDPDIGSLNSESPTMTKDSRVLLLQTVSSMRWTVRSFDTAFLRGKSDDRELAMEAPRQLRDLMGMGPENVCLLKGNAYGRVDAPLLFYKEFHKSLENAGFRAHPLDSCLFLLRNKKLSTTAGWHSGNTCRRWHRWRQQNYCKKRLWNSSKKRCLSEPGSLENSSLQVLI